MWQMKPERAEPQHQWDVVHHIFPVSFCQFGRASHGEGKIFTIADWKNCPYQAKYVSRS